MIQTDSKFMGDQPAIWKAQLPGRPLSGLTVLLVEDSHFASEAMRLLCLKSGARIRRANCLRAAMRHLQTYRPAVVIVDMGLPDGNGADLIALIATLGHRAPAILAISGNPDMGDSARAAGADNFLAKPIESLAVFQLSILDALPPDRTRHALRALPNGIVSPDRAMLHDDLLHVAEILSTDCDGQTIGYAARFLGGVARSAHDPALTEAAAALARDHAAGENVADQKEQINGLIQARLSAAGRA
ncbi:MAG: response regulator [Paracoccus sp. (in: a-proteobacteria)]